MARCTSRWRCKFDDADALLVVNAYFASLMTWDEWLDTPGLKTVRLRVGRSHRVKYTTLLDSSSITVLAHLPHTWS